MIPEILRVIQIEGGYVNNQNDKGGETKYGISKRSYPNLDIKNITSDQAYEIIKRDFYDVMKIGQVVDPSVRSKLIELAVHMGVPVASKLVQGVVGVKVDGIIGPITVSAINGKPNGADLVNQIMKAQLLYYCDRVEKDPGQSVFLRGWVKRAVTA